MEDHQDSLIHVLELFSGIGGMHYALSRAKEILKREVFDFKVVAAMDISDVANKVYRHNFPGTNHSAGNICGLTAAKINKLEIDAILMSPPCQPFTRQGHQKDLNDSRSEPLMHIIDLLPQLQKLKYILVENVKGFETSEACKQLIKVLHTLNYDTKSFLISPPELGVPNSRLRFYLLARKTNNACQIPEVFNPSKDIITDLTTISDVSEIAKSFALKSEPGLLKEYLRNDSQDDTLLLSDNILSKYGQVLDIVNCTSNNSCCFTKSYGRYAEGTGSVIQQDGNLDRAYERAKVYDKKSDEYVKILKELKLRYFDPYEIASLLGFPVEENSNSQIKFEFPPGYSDKKLHCYRVLGNSLNVKVVAFLCCILFKKDAWL